MSHIENSLEMGSQGGNISPLRDVGEAQPEDRVDNSHRNSLDYQPVHNMPEVPPEIADRVPSPAPYYLPNSKSMSSLPEQEQDLQVGSDQESVDGHPAKDIRHDREEAPTSPASNPSCVQLSPSVFPEVLDVFEEFLSDYGVQLMVLSGAHDQDVNASQVIQKVLPSDNVILRLRKMKQDLIKVSREGNYTELKRLLDPKSMSNDEFKAVYPIVSRHDITSPLHEAVSAASIDCVTLLVEKIKMVEEHNDNDVTNDTIEKNGKNGKKDEVRKKDPPSRINLFRNSETALMRAVKSSDAKLIGIIQYLIKQGASIFDKETNLNRNLLHFACLYGNKKAAKILLGENKKEMEKEKENHNTDKERGKEGEKGRHNLLLDTDNRGESPLHLAIIHNKENMAKLMIKKANSFEELNGDCNNRKERESKEGDSKNEKKAPDKMKAIENEIDEARKEIIQKLNESLDNKDAIDRAVKRYAAATATCSEEGEAAREMHKASYPNLHLACMHGRSGIVDKLFKKEKKLNSNGAKLVNMLDFEKKTPLHWALEYKHFDIAKLCLCEGPDLTQFLPKKNKHRMSLLHLIAGTGDNETVNFLMAEMGPNINLKVDDENAHTETPLHAATAQGNLDVCKALIDSPLTNHIRTSLWQTLQRLHRTFEYSKTEIAVLLG